MDLEAIVLGIFVGLALVLTFAVAGLSSDNRRLRSELLAHMDDAAYLRRSKRAGMRRLCEWVDGR